MRRHWSCGQRGGLPARHQEVSLQGGTAKGHGRCDGQEDADADAVLSRYALDAAGHSVQQMGPRMRTG
jgi:hypothetical protein